MSGPFHSSVGFLSSVRPWKEIPRLYRILDPVFTNVVAPFLTRGLLSVGRIQYRQLEVIGADRVPKHPGQPIVFASNHLSYLDPPLVAAAITVAHGKKPIIMAKRELWKKLGYRISFPVFGALPFDRHPKGREGYLVGLRPFASALLAGRSVLECPEATIPGELEIGPQSYVRRRSDVSKSHGLLGGAGFMQATELAFATHALIVPVGVSGSGAACPPEVNPAGLFAARRKRDHRIRIVFGEPLRLADFIPGFEPGHEHRAFLPFAAKILPQAISALVDFSMHEVPIDHPITESTPISESELSRIRDYEREVAEAYRRRGRPLDETFAALACGDP